MINRCLLLFLGFLACTSSVAQRRDPARKLPAKIAAADLAKDIDILCDALKKSHPRYDRYHTAVYFDSVYRAKRAWIMAQRDGITNGRAYLELSEMVGVVKDGHTYLIRSLKRNAFTRPKVNLSLLDDAYILTGLEKADSIFLFAKCLKINGTPVDSLMPKWIHARASDGWNETFPKRMAGVLAFDYYQAQFQPVETWHIEAMCQDGVQRTLTIKGKKWLLSKAERSAERAAEKVKRKHKPAPGPLPPLKGDTATSKAKDIQLYRRKHFATLYRPGLDTSVVVLDIGTFVFGRYRRFYKQCFRYLNAHPPRLLVVDVRENLGGRVSNVKNLLGYFMERPYTWRIARQKDIIHSANNQLWPDKIKLKRMPPAKKTERKGNLICWKRTFKPHAPTKRFKAKNVVVLQNSFSFSGGSIVASVLKNLCGAIAIGNETGGGEVSLNALRIQKIKLPHSGIQLQIASHAIDMEVGRTDKGHGVLPDIKVLPTIESLKAKRDAMLEAAILKR